jgi:D-alanine-D-alanine ligase-like ATP-grasp enzyme
MAKMNQQRALVAILKQICERRGIVLAAFSNDWMFRLQKDGHVTHVFGYDFDINGAVAKMICKDKSATSDLLQFHGIPHIAHHIYHSPALKGYVPMSGNWSAMLAFLADHPHGVVCKPNEGTGGGQVSLVKTPLELEEAVLRLFQKSRSLCLSPFESFDYEYRVAALSGGVEFAYRKIRPSVTGDGVRPFRSLLQEFVQNHSTWASLERETSSLVDGKMNLDAIPDSGKVVILNWRHNLGQGALPEMLTPSSVEWDGITSLALQATATLGVELASVDIAQTTAGFKVLEINSGIMMENLVLTHPDGLALVERFYDRIICAALQIK